MSELRLDREGPLAILTLDHPRRRNALGPEFWDNLAPLVARIDADPEIRVALLTGEGPSFTSGLDLQRMASQLPIDLGPTAADGQRTAALHALIRRMQQAITSVERCRVPVIAAIQGHCIGGGIDLITAADIRLCSSDAIFSVRETRLAMVADVGTLQRLPAIVGPGRARELVFTGRDFGAEEALKMGLVEEVLPDKPALLARARALAAEIAKNPPLAVQGAKRVLVEADRARIDTSLEYVATWNAAYLRTEDLGAALAAALTQQTPTFKGK